MYEDILKFQRIILLYFQQPQWQKVFSESWVTCKSRFTNIFRDIARRGSLIESHATPAEIEEARESIQESRQAEINEFDEQNERRFGDVRKWLGQANAEVDQSTYVQVRAEYPGTGQWLLDNQSFKEWFHPRYATIPPLLWLNGIPGAGKTMLASLVVQKASELKPAPTVLYFYCKHEDPERDNFVALGRSMLAQFLHQDNELLPIFYQRSYRSGEAVLSSSQMVEELLTLAFGNCKNAYIVLDGLDECPREQRKTITKWFRKLIDNLPSKEADRLRCLFISQDDGPARKDFAGLASVKIGAEDTQRDIEEYCQVQAAKLLDNHPAVSNEKANWIATTVANSAKGIFLLASLIWTNLSHQTSIARIEAELQPDVFPKEINHAYQRIMVRINEQAPNAAKGDISRLLSWLVCAKKSLKWHEIQVMNSINCEERCVQLERQSFIKSPKDMLASLVETRADGSLEFVHLSAKFFLLEEGHVVPSAEELKLAILCIDYLNLPAFIQPPVEAGIWKGNYGFMDYAVLFWLRHLEVGVLLADGGNIELMNELRESLEIFVSQYWSDMTAIYPLAKRYSEKLQYFKALPFYDQLEQAIAATKQQQKDFGDKRVEEDSLKITRMVCSVRKAIETIASGDLEENDRETIEKRYGTNIFKCPRFSCQFFTTGFASSTDRNEHISQHERPFRCSQETCYGYTFGFSSTVDLEKHLKEFHSEVAIQDEEFPTLEDIHVSIMDRQKAAGTSGVSDPPSSEDGMIDDPITTGVEGDASEAESEVEPQYQSWLKRARQTEFQCPHCNAVYNKRYNLQSHLLSHESQRSHVCLICLAGFARPNDLKRHMNTHTGDRSFVCRGFLRNGQSWGCGRSFARADTLNKHHESRVGRACIQPLLQESSNQPLLQESSNQPLLQESSNQPLLHESSNQPLLQDSVIESVLQELFTEPIPQEPFNETLLQESLQTEVDHDQWWE
ncbi:hypothetical protein G7054_g8019 [Neopestalotiopsis clavispora]|nr:hypothetical protein G7054_g8019 [Neopestalotiopsis clavispora]